MKFLSNAILLNKRFNVKSLLDCYNHTKHLKAIPAGFPGEGNIAWNSLTLFSLGADNNLLTEIPYLSNEFKRLNLQIRLVRFLILESGGVIKKHADNFLSDHIVRLHIPIVTDPCVEFFIQDQACNWKAGEFWFGNFSLPHYGQNNSNVTRVHLVIDVTVDENLLLLFPRSEISEDIGNEIDKQRFKEDVLKRFITNFELPTGFQLPGLDFSKLEEALVGNIELAGNELLLYINRQPMLKIEPVSEDRLALIGLGLDAFLDFKFNKQNISSLVLSIADKAMPISVF